MDYYELNKCCKTFASGNAIASLSVALVPEGLQLNSLFGRSSDLPESAAFPYGWAVQWHGWQTLRRAYSSGHCCRFARHSLGQIGCKCTAFF